MFDAFERAFKRFPCSHISKKYFPYLSISTCQKLLVDNLLETNSKCFHYSLLTKLCPDLSLATLLRLPGTPINRAPDLNSLSGGNVPVNSKEAFQISVLVDDKKASQRIPTEKAKTLGENNKTPINNSLKNKNRIFLTIIPRTRVRYEVIDS